MSGGENVLGNHICVIGNLQSGDGDISLHSQPHTAQRRRGLDNVGHKSWRDCFLQYGFGEGCNEALTGGGNEGVCLRAGRVNKRRGGKFKVRINYQAGACDKGFCRKRGEEIKRKIFIVPLTRIKIIYVQIVNFGILKRIIAKTFTASTPPPNNLRKSTALNGRGRFIVIVVIVTMVIIAIVLARNVNISDGAMVKNMVV